MDLYGIWCVSLEIMFSSEPDAEFCSQPNAFSPYDVLGGETMKYSDQTPREILQVFSLLLQTNQSFLR